jgi:hypothetical protein
MLSDFSFSEDTVGFLIDGVMDKDAIVELRSRILKKLERYDKINLYLEDVNIERFSFSAVKIATLFPVENKDRFHKIALVTDRKWIHALGALDTILVGVTIRNFDTSNRLKAMSWIANSEIQSVKD